MSTLRSLASPERLRWMVPLAVFLFALGLRLIGIGWGLPNDLHNSSYHPDEEVVLGASQGIEPTKYPWTPHFYNYGTLYLLTLRISSDITESYTGAYESQNEASVVDFVRRCHIAGRILSAIAGAASALIVLLMLRRFTSEFGAVMGAGLVAVAPGYVVHSRFQTVDVLATFLLIVSAYYAVKILYPSEGKESDSKRVLLDSAWAGLFAGLSAGTKYTGMLGLVVLFVALALAKRPARWQAAILGLAVAVAAFLLVTPGAIADTERFMRDTVFEMRHTSTGHGLIFEGTSSGFLYHLGNLFTGIGTIMTLVALGGLVYGAIRRQPWAFAFLAFFVVYYFLIGRAEVKFLRYTFPLYLSLAAGFGWAMGKAREEKGWGHAAVGLGILGLGGADPGGLRSAIQYSAVMARQDARDAVARSFKRIATERSITVGLASDPWYYTPALYPYTAMTRQRDYAIIDFPMRQADHPKVERFVPRGPDGEPLYDQRVDWDVRLLTDSKPDFVVFSNFELADPLRLRRLANRSPGADALVTRYNAFEKELQERYVAYDIAGMPGTEKVQDMMYVTPGLQIWKRKDLR